MAETNNPADARVTEALKVLELLAIEVTQMVTDKQVSRRAAQAARANAQCVVTAVNRALGDPSTAEEAAHQRHRERQHHFQIIRADVLGAQDLYRTEVMQGSRYGSAEALLRQGMALGRRDAKIGTARALLPAEAVASILAEIGIHEG